MEEEQLPFGGRGARLVIHRLVEDVGLVGADLDRLDHAQGLDEEPFRLAALLLHDRAFRFETGCEEVEDADAQDGRDTAIIASALL